MKLCPTCHEVKPLGEYHESRRNGTQWECKRCSSARARRRYLANREHHLEVGRRYHAANVERVRIRARERTYGLQSGEFEALVTQQGGQCAICRQERPLQIDHDHDSSRVRGLLCNGCNTGLGLLGDDLAGIRQVVAYLEHAQVPGEVVAA